MSARSYDLCRQQANLKDVLSAFYETKTSIIAYRQFLKDNYHAQEQPELLYACDQCIERIQYLINQCNDLKEQLMYYERMRL